MIPLKVYNRLKLGRDVAAEVTATHPYYRAWIYVKPVLVTYDNPDYGLERRAINFRNESPMQYEVRYIELHPKYLEYPADLDKAWIDDLTQDQRYSVTGENALESILSRWLHDLNMLKIPSTVAYPRLPIRRI